MEEKMSRGRTVHGRVHGHGGRVHGQYIYILIME